MSWLGEQELAIDGLTKAAQENPTWTVPLVMLSALSNWIGVLPAMRSGSSDRKAWQRSQQN